MTTDILMPALSPTMTEGTLARWLKQEGDVISAGDVLAEIETDKATMEVEAVDEGILGKILVPAGTANVAVNASIAIMVDVGEEVPADKAKLPAPPQATTADASADTATPSPPENAQFSKGGERSVAMNEASSEPRVVASPLARRLAKDAKIDLTVLKGSGPQGRIVRADVELAKSGGARLQTSTPSQPAVSQSPPVPVSPATSPTAPLGLSRDATLKLAATAIAPPVIAAPHRLVKHSTMRKVIARRLTEAKQTVPHFYLSVDVQLDRLLALRSDLNARSPLEGRDRFKLSVNDFIIKASAVALRQVPAVNASYTDSGTVFYDDVDIAVAVAVPDGLMTPIIRQADRKGLVAITTEMKALADRAKAGKLQPDEYQGGGFSISNLGMFGITSFSAVINPPQGAILAVGVGEPRAMVRDGQIVAATMMTCTMSVDHRVIDGALGAQWLQAFRRLVEDPLGLML